MAAADTIDFRKLSDMDWRQRLNANQYMILRQHGTERAGSSPLNKEKRKGTFACAGCDLPLFSSDTKFESGTGWPSFYQPLSNAVETRTDRSYFMTRTSVRVMKYDRSVIFHDPHGSALCALPWASRARLRRWAEADRLALLHEWDGLEVHSGNAGIVLSDQAQARHVPK